ncbi:MAG: hypothetical protein KAI95_05425 [Bacteroidales bacterium]|nr:hypothetical protein [Bacteroidales bacterium]
MKTLDEAMQMYGGIFLWVQILVILLMLVMAIIKFKQYYGNSNLASLPFHKSHHAILFLGIFNLVWGMFTQVLGFVQALNAIIAAADVSPTLIMEGLKNSFVSPLIGLVSILIGALLWAILQARFTTRTR